MRNAELSFRARIGREAKAAVRKGERTRLRLMQHGARLLDGVRPAELQIVDVCSAAGLAKGTFYVHYATKEAFLEALCRRFVEFERSTFPALPEEDPYGAVHGVVDWYERIFAANVGVMRCMVQMTDVQPTFVDIWVDRNRAIVDLLVAHLARLLGVRADRTRGLRAAMNAVGGMLDQSLFARYRVSHRGLLGAGALAESIELHSLFAFRTVFGANPPASGSARSRALVRQTALDRWRG